VNFWQINGKTRLKFLENLREKRLVSAEKHNELPLKVWGATGHTVETLPAREWSQYPGLLEAHGLVLDYLGNVIARMPERYWDAETMSAMAGQAPDQWLSVHRNFTGPKIVMRDWGGRMIFASHNAFYDKHTGRAEKFFAAIKWGHHLFLDDHYSYTFALESGPGDMVLLAAHEGVNELPPTSGNDVEEMLTHWASGMHAGKEIPTFAASITGTTISRLGPALKGNDCSDFSWSGWPDGIVLRYPDGMRATMSLEECKELGEIPD
jgi:hypothetical protein